MEKNPICQLLIVLVLEVLEAADWMLDFPAMQYTFAAGARGSSHAPHVYAQRVSQCVYSVRNTEVARPRGLIAVGSRHR